MDRSLAAELRTVRRRKISKNSRQEIRGKMNSGSNNEMKSTRPGSLIGVGVAIGAGVGVALGVALDNIALGIPIGIGVGVAIGAALEQRRKDSDGDM